MLERVRNQGLVLLGCGKMGSAMLEGWLKQGVPPAAIWVLEPHPSDWLTATGVHLNAGLPAAPAIVLLAVKPQMMGAALPQVTALGNGATVFLSIAAGTTIASFESTFGARTPIIRAMPNTPAAVGRGITAITGNAHASDPDLALAEALLTAVGQVVRLEGEHQMDAVTAVSGSGPAYVFYLVECMAEAGRKAGLPADLAMRLARETVAGAGELLHQSPDDASRLRQNVTSPGGTTAAALEVLMAEDGMKPLMRKAVAAAKRRAGELSG